jgi:ketosteroid isomerase-like protein
MLLFRAPLLRAENSSYPPLEVPMKIDRPDVGQPDADWSAFMAKLEAAEVEFASGRPESFKALWSHTSDVTLFGALGGPIEVGWDNVAARLDWGSSNYAEGVRSRQEISLSVGANFAYLVQNETIDASIGARADERSKQELRVTMVFRRESDGWRIVHRHADSQMSTWPPRSTRTL